MSETGTEEVFDGLAPKLAGTWRVPLEAAIMSGDGIISVIVHLSVKGKDEMHNVMKICRKATAFLDKLFDSVGAEAFHGTVGEIMRCLRVLTMIGGPYCMLWPQVVDAFDGHVASKEDQGGQVCGDLPGALCLDVKLRLVGAARRACCLVRGDRHARSPDSAVRRKLRGQRLSGRTGGGALPATGCEEHASVLGRVQEEGLRRQLKFEEEFKKRVRNLFAAKNDFSEHCLASAMVTLEVYLGERCADSPVHDYFVL